MKAFITGINGQDGSYLAEYLIAKNYEVHGTVRRSSSINTKKIDHLISTHQGKNLYLYYSDLLDSSSLTNLISKIEPNEIYNLAAQSHVAVSFQNPLFTTETSTVGPLSLLESIRNIDKDIKFIIGGRLMEWRSISFCMALIASDGAATIEPRLECVINAAMTGMCDEQMFACAGL